MILVRVTKPENGDGLILEPPGGGFHTINEDNAYEQLCKLLQDTEQPSAHHEPMGKDIIGQIADDFLGRIAETAAAKLMGTMRKASFRGEKETGTNGSDEPPTE